MAEAESAIGRVEAETTVSRLLYATCVELVDLVDASRSVISKVIGDLIVQLSEYRRSGDDRSLELFLLSDYPLTQELIVAGEPRIVLTTDRDADPAEAALLERLGFESLLMMPLRSHGKNWGLVEIYGDGRGFAPAHAEAAFALVERVGDLLAELESAP